VTDSRKTLIIEPNNLSVRFNSGDNLLDTLNANKIGISQSCGGHGTCTTCRVYVLNESNSAVSDRTEIEEERAHERNFSANERLACQTQVFSDVKIQIAQPTEN
jgi:ferredoxin